MNKKDLTTLMENYEKIFENTLATINQDNQTTGVENALDNISAPPVVDQPETMPVVDVTPALPAPQTDDQFKRMTIANLKSLCAHTQRILDSLESGLEIEAWMNDKITGSANDMLDVWNALEFRA
jgi:hypothetical protein